jgi:hypothetical protein
MNQEYAELMFEEINSPMKKLFDALKEDGMLDARGIAAALALSGTLLIYADQGDVSASDDITDTVEEVLDVLEENPKAFGFVLVKMSNMMLDAHHKGISRGS